MVRSGQPSATTSRDDLRRFTLAALGLWALWSLATWVFEGRIDTLLRPDAILDRIIYVIVTNIVIGLGGGALLIRWITRQSAVRPEDLGFGPLLRTLVWLPLAVLLGLALYFAQGAPTTDPMVMANIYAQVLVVSIAEVLVCWCLVAGVSAHVLPGPKWVSITLAAIVASALFGLYHYAHSPPFNTFPMVALLSGVGLMTGAMFFLSQDIYATAVFHNFLAVFGVASAVKANDQIAAYQTLQLPLFGMALTGILVLAAADVLVIRHKAK